MITNLVPKSSECLLKCDICDYNTSRKSQYDRHLLTSKHIINNKLITPNVQIKIYECENCGNQYKYQSGLCAHKKKCIQEENIINVQTDNIEPIKPFTPTIDIEGLTNMFIDTIKQNQEFQKQMFEMMKDNMASTTISNSNNTTNSHNKQFNLQFFLNETCKDAMNITEFINSLHLQLDDLEYTGDNGYVAGVSKIFLQELNQLDICKRPIHCSDAKREIFHIKNNENQWEKERVLLIKMIKQITTQNIILLTTWREAHPGCEGYYHKLNDRYLKITGEALGSADDAVELRNFNKIIANVAKATLIDKHNNN